eukprot:CAMPEP_0118992096 /NCGR_PEP_ID=MMETSP1173-20130426/52787_1 /TAXON_ID=1034831 /ORGANISM="Rhizochromulina marina cf, Strain CCMP1243" /LENGTH=60 /DNA_ID=CAMNT_0006943261 /DNA_START=291 /DNA_END=473 /DNA_ORIENTATION=-
MTWRVVERNDLECPNGRRFGTREGHHLADDHDVLPLPQGPRVDGVFRAFDTHDASAIVKV